MRDEKTWEARNKDLVVRELPPRIQQDLVNLKTTKKREIKSYYIWGPVKTGKTLLAASLYIEAHKQNFINASHKKIIFWKMSELTTKIKSLFGENKEELIFTEELKQADILVIDDFGVDKASEWVVALMYSLIDYRYEYLKTTIITSNYNLEDLCNVFGDDRIPSRIERMCSIIEKTEKN